MRIKSTTLIEKSAVFTHFFILYYNTFIRIFTFRGERFEGFSHTKQKNYFQNSFAFAYSLRGITGVYADSLGV